jgi:flagellar hook-associated protein 3 FlgL
MTTNYISTQYLSSSLQLSVLKMQTELATAQAESASGQYADIGLQLGNQAGQEISLQNENGLLQT